MDLKITPSGQTIVKPTALGPGANTDTKLLIYGLFQKGRVLAQDGSAFSKEADYSDLLDALCGTAAERQQLLRGYFELSADDREEGTKQPTATHRAIAALAAKGFIRVILTTNFDRLIETALDDAGVAPAVLTTPDQLQGALPLIHMRCCVVKLHGDYLDTRIRNTQAELDSYPAEFSRLLDRVFDEFGLVV